VQIKWTDKAKDDLNQIRLYLKQNVSPEYAKKVTQEIKEEVNSLKTSPGKGTYVAELEKLNMTDHRQLLAHQNRIIFERTTEICYIHVVCHTSMNLQSLLMRRLLT
jgi:plasmid stabilization system protein ParE